MENLNLTLKDAIFKDASPIKTVEKIKSILDKHNIRVTECWHESGVEHCFSLRITVDGTAFGVNGKGLTKEFAQASGYGELMERMQLGLFSDSSVQKIGHYNEVIGKDERVSMNHLLEELPDWYRYLADKACELDGTERCGKDILSRFADANGDVAAIPFYSLTRGKIVSVPRELRSLVCGSSGGAAGNTMEEAIVQALSEIVERNHMQRAIRECISLPDIPEEVLQKYATAYSIINSLRERGFRVIVKDCSFGTRFPVVCVCYIHEATGKYHSHFGAYPILEIALERALTESFQGRHIESFTKNEDFIYSSSQLSSYRSVYMGLKKGDFEKTPQFFVGECTYPYNENVGFSGESNTELLPQLIAFFTQQGYEILVHNSSFLGFPTYSVFIPKYSEVIFHSLSTKHGSFSNSKNAIAALRFPSNSSFDDCIALLLHISEMKKLGEVDPRLFRFSTCAKLAMAYEPKLDSFLLSSSLAYIYYSMGNLTQVSEHINKMLALASNDHDKERILCLKRYIAMSLNDHSEDSIKKLLTFFHKDETVSWLYSYIENGLNPFDVFVLKCNEKDCDGCTIAHICMQKYTMSLVSIIHEMSKKLSIEEFVSEIGKYAAKQ